ncbi:MAG: ComF family protein [Crocinitomicaceae bacterium]
MVYPEKCLVCDEELTKNELNICSFCSQDLERTFFESYSEPTPMDQLFWGRVSVEKTYAHYYFKKQGGIQKLLFSLKYGKNQLLGEELGKAIGKELNKHTNKYDFDVLIPVPLHPKRQFKRGYNQSELLAKGIANELNCIVHNSAVLRRSNNKTQTGKSRFERWDNVSSVFTVSEKSLAAYNHIAIVDDVITTGSTIEALISEIHNIYPDIKISIVTLAIA